MKSSIKLKNGEELAKILEYPNELAILIQIALNLDEVTGISSKVKYKKKYVDNLVLWRIISEVEEGYTINNKKIIDVTLKKQHKIENIRSTLLTDLCQDDIPDNDKDYFKIAISFRDLFMENLIAIKIRTINIESAVYSKWVDPIRLMIENDKVTLNQLRDVWKFLNRHPFWSANVQSTSKLREKFQTIHTQLKSDGAKRVTDNQSKGNVSTKYLERVFNDLQSK